MMTGVDLGHLASPVLPAHVVCQDELTQADVAAFFAWMKKIQTKLAIVPVRMLVIAALRDNFFR
jgi:hypothetical protein